MMTKKERRYYLYCLVNFMMELDEVMKKFAYTCIPEEKPISKEDIDLELNILMKRLHNLTDEKGKIYDHNDYFESDRDLQRIKDVIDQFLVTLMWSSTNVYMVEDHTSGDSMYRWNKRREDFEFEMFNKEVVGAYKELCELIELNKLDMTQEYMENCVFAQDLEEALILDAILDYIGIFAFPGAVDYNILTFELFEKAVFGGICCYVCYDHNVYLAKNKEGKVLYATYKEDGQEKGYFVTVYNSKYLKRFEDIPSIKDHPFYKNTVICDASLLTDWHFGRNNEQNKNEKPGKKEDEKTGDAIGDINGNKKQKKAKKEKKKVDYKGLFSKIFAIVAYPFIKIWRGLKFIGGKIKSFFSKITNWFKKKFIDPIKIKKAANEVVYGNKSQKVKEKNTKSKTKTKEYKSFRFRLPEFRLPSFNLKIDPTSLLFFIPVIICFVVFLGFENNWFSISFFDDLNASIKFVDDYGTWAEAVQEWLNEPLEDIGTIPGFLAFFAYYPATLIAYILEGIWWLLSWVIIGVIKLLVFLIAKIVFILPFILFGGGVLMGVFMFAKADKNTSVIIGFALSMIVCITLGVLIFV